MNFKIIEDFITMQEREEIINYGNIQKDVSIDEITNVHVKTISEQLKGISILCDLTSTELSKAVSTYQSGGVSVDCIPQIFHDIKDRIANRIDIKKDHVFFQYLGLRPGGHVAPHYDAAFPGYITYKCNVTVCGPEIDEIHVHKDVFKFPERSLYCFEANLYKHWATACDTKRIILSYGFILPYADLGWTEDAPRVRLSNKIWNSFQH